MFCFYCEFIERNLVALPMFSHGKCHRYTDPRPTRHPIADENSDDFSDIATFHNICIREFVGANYNYLDKETAEHHFSLVGESLPLRSLAVMFHGSEYFSGGR